MKKTGQKTAEETVVYIGPSFYGTLQENTAFCGGFSPKVEELTEKHGYLKGLFVPVNMLAEARKELKRPGSEKNMLYRRAEEEKYV